MATPAPEPSVAENSAVKRANGGLDVFLALRMALQTIRRDWKTLLGIDMLLAVVVMMVGGAAVTQVAGFSATPSGLDPAALPYTMTSSQWVIAGLAALAIVVFVSLSGAASVIVAGNRLQESGPLGVRGAFGRVKASSMQLFWLQWIVMVLSFQFSSYAAPLLWLGIASAIPVAVLEQLGPAAAVDRAWILSQGGRLRLVLLEVGLTGLIPLILLLFTTYVLISGGPVNFENRSTLWRMPVAFVMITMVAAVAQFMMVSLTCAYWTMAGQVVGGGTKVKTA